MRKNQPKRKVTAIDQHIGKRLRYIRITKNLSQAELANLIGVTFQQLQKYEQGKNRISASRLYQISQILEISLVSFFEDLSSKKYEIFYNEMMIDKDFIALIKSWKKITNPEIKRFFQKLIEYAIKHT